MVAVSLSSLLLRSDRAGRPVLGDWNSVEDFDLSWNSQLVFPLDLTLFTHFSTSHLHLPSPQLSPFFLQAQRLLLQPVLQRHPVKEVLPDDRLEAGAFSWGMLLGNRDMHAWKNLCVYTNLSLVFALLPLDAQRLRLLGNFEKGAVKVSRKRLAP